jgi:DNA replication protein DnaC
MNNHIDKKTELPSSTNIYLISQLLKTYPEVSVDNSNGTFAIDMTKLGDVEYGDVITSLTFARQNPTLPIENVFNTLFNYNPVTPSQQDFVAWINRFLALPIDQSAGIYAWGDPGIGKTHISVAATKELMVGGVSVAYFKADQAPMSVKQILNWENVQVWILDDLNIGYGKRDFFKPLVMHLHDSGGRLLITSNKPYENLLEELLPSSGSDLADRLRYEDRMQGFFKVLHVEGQSTRQSKAWYKD